MKRSFLVLLLLFALSVVTNAQQPASIRPEREAIDNLIREWSAAIRAGDAEKLGTLVTDDVEFWGDGTPPLIGKAVVVSTFANTFDRFSLVQNIEERERVWDESFVIIRGIESTKVSDKGVLRSTEMRRRVFMMVRRDADGQWRIARGMSNSPPLVQ